MKVISGFILVEPIYTQETNKGIITPELCQLPIKGKVVEFDSSCKNIFSVGDIIWYGKYDGIPYQDKKFIREECIRFIEKPDGKIYPPINNVIVKLERRPDELKSKGGLYLELVNKFNPGQNCPVFGTVISLPEITHKDWGIKEGDNVWASYADVVSLLGKLGLPTDDLDDPTMYIVDNEFYISIPYDVLIVAKRGEDIICLNDYCLVEPENEFEYSELLTKEQLERKSKHIGQLIHATPNNVHKVGDRVVIGKAWNLVLEHPPHNKFSDKVLYTVKLSGILMSVEKDAKITVKS